MRILVIFMFITSLTWAQETTTRDLLESKAPCVFEMTVEDLTAYELYFTCDESKPERSFGIEDFKLKIRGQRTLHVAGSMLDAAARDAISKVQIGEQIMIFDIQQVVTENKAIPQYRALVVKIVE